MSKEEKVDQEHKMKVEQLKESRDEVIRLINKYLLKVDIFYAVEKVSIITSAKNQALENLTSLLLSLNNDIYNASSNDLARAPSLFINEYLAALDREDITPIMNLRNIYLSDFKIIELNHKPLISHPKIKPLIDKIEELATAFAAEVVKKNSLEKETGLTFAEIITLDATIDNFLNIYSDIVGIDLRNDTNKAKGYREYFKNIIDKTHADNITKVMSSLK